MGVRFIKTAVVYFVVSIAVLTYMTLAGDQAAGPLFINTAVLGWCSLALTGIIYHFFPKAGENKLAHLHFWLYNTSLPLFLTGLLLELTNMNIIFPLLPVSVTLLSVAIFVFMYNVFSHVKKRRRL
ncbi:cytochrome-c oxidase [Alteribacter keqinensis]|uniref:Cytochrome-c oxidase n=1 Tax=Alteribacter keqinensis TaxID=2483800 RepID=A0A3M7TPT4_9BACI|nr:cytochrome-c oxidase [Alteribacter keqinensis]RNA67027.1 cytochrome-c oxidase [Alteribacter keqinensis]